MRWRLNQEWVSHHTARVAASRPAAVREPKASHRPTGRGRRAVARRRFDWREPGWIPAASSDARRDGELASCCSRLRRGGSHGARRPTCRGWAPQGVRMPSKRSLGPASGSLTAGHSVELPRAWDSVSLGIKQACPLVRCCHVDSKDGCTHERVGQPVDRHTMLRAQIVDTSSDAGPQSTERASRFKLRVAKGTCVSPVSALAAAL